MSPSVALWRLILQTQCFIFRTLYIFNNHLKCILSPAGLSVTSYALHSWKNYIFSSRKFKINHAATLLRKYLWLSTSHKIKSQDLTLMFRVCLSLNSVYSLSPWLIPTFPNPVQFTTVDNLLFPTFATLHMTQQMLVDWEQNPFLSMFPYLSLLCLLFGNSYLFFKILFKTISSMKHLPFPSMLRLN